MVAASLHHYLRGHSRTFVVAAIAIGTVAALLLLAYAVFGSGLMNGPSPDDQLMAPFRWWNVKSVA
jgi:hypothetical protein